MENGKRDVIRRFEARRKQMPLTVARAKRIIRESPHSDGARVLREMIDMGDIGRALRPDFVRSARRVTATLDRRAKEIAPRTGKR